MPLTEVSEGILRADKARVVTESNAEILDLLSEGQVDTLVTGKMSYDGNLGEYGWRTVTETPYDIPAGETNRWLRSVFWNEVPLVDSESKYNYQEIDVSFTNGVPNGSSLGSVKPELTITRPIGEPLRGSSLDRPDADTADDFAKIYRILNKDAKGVIVNIRIDSLSKQIIEPTPGRQIGDIVDATIEYHIFYKPIFSSGRSVAYSAPVIEIVTGKLTSGGYIKSTEIQWGSNLDDEDFIGWQIKIVKRTPEATSAFERSVTGVDSITEIYGNIFTYPNTAIFRSKFNARFFAALPSRAYDVKLLKVEIPDNYNQITKNYKKQNGDVSYDGTEDYWDGTFNTTKKWTDNPAWCFRDFVVNNRYGLGKHIDSSFVDKWTLYEIAKYCDQLVSDGFGGLEPRFTCNLMLTSREEAYRVLSDFASIFRAMAFYGQGQIFLSQDAPKAPVVQFTNANVQDGDFQYASSSRRVRHTAALVRYNNKEDFFKPAAEYVEDIDGIRKYGYRLLEITSFGTTSRGQATRFGRWALLSETLETETITFTAGLEGSYLRPGDIFKVFDGNKKTKRYAGRIKAIDNNEGSDQAIVTLDSKIALTNATNYNFSLLTPSFHYEPSMTTGLVSTDYDNIRKPFLQLIQFSGAQASGVSGVTQITLDSAFNSTNYQVSGFPVWTLELASGATTQEEIEQFTTSGTDLYRVIRTKEDNNKFIINGLEYKSTKFTETESGIGFERSTIEYGAMTIDPPTNFSLEIETI